MSRLEVNRRGFLKRASALTGTGAVAFGLEQTAAGQSATGPNEGKSVPARSSAVFSRDEMVTMISDYFNWVHSSEYNDYAKAVPRTFSDVKAGDRYVKQIECALEENIIAPDEKNCFYPDKPMTRQDAAVVFALAFMIPSPATDALAAFSDHASADPAARSALNALVAGGYMKGVTAKELKPAAPIQRAEAKEILQKITAARVSPVQEMPKSGTTSYRRNIHMTSPTPGATIYYTIANDGSAPPDPTTSSKKYDYTEGYVLLDNPPDSKTDYKYWTMKAIAVKQGMLPSPVRTFSYVIYRPQKAPFQARLVHALTTTSPVVWDIMNPSDYNRPHVYYIEGTSRGVVLDAGQYPLAGGANLKTFIDSIATKPYDAVLGHNHPDHNEQIDSYVEGGIKLYMTAQDKGAILASKRSDFVAAANASLPVKDGDVFDLGNVQMTACQIPGHENGLVFLQDKKNGWVFGTDMFGCNRPATVDITNYSGAKMDLFLSLVQQLYSRLRKNCEGITEVYNAHNEVPVGYAGILNFQKAVQQLIDVGDTCTVPSMRGTSPGGQPIPKLRTSVVGDMWRDKNWMALWVGGNWGEPVNYLTSAHANYKCNNTIDYCAPGGIKKYSVLSNIEIEGGELVGVDVTWAPPANGVPNTLPNLFDPWTYSYDIKVQPGAKSITIIPIAMSNNITSLKINGAPAKSGAAKSIEFAENAQVKIDVVAPDGVTTSNYVFTLKKP